jgi:uncharacterized protein YjbJ (UPF0337 family)
MLFCDILLNPSKLRIKRRIVLLVSAMSNMNEEGNKDKAEGKIREGVGKLTDDKSEQMKGKMQQVKGDVEKDLSDDE